MDTNKEQNIDVEEASSMSDQSFERPLNTAEMFQTENDFLCETLDDRTAQIVFSSPCLVNQITETEEDVYDGVQSENDYTLAQAELFKFQIAYENRVSSSVKQILDKNINHVIKRIKEDRYKMIYDTNKYEYYKNQKNEIPAKLSYIKINEESYSQTPQTQVNFDSPEYQFDISPKDPMLMKNWNGQMQNLMKTINKIESIKQIKLGSRLSLNVQLFDKARTYDSSDEIDSVENQIDENFFSTFSYRQIKNKMNKSPTPKDIQEDESIIFPLKLEQGKQRGVKPFKIKKQRSLQDCYKARLNYMEELNY